MLDHFGQRSKLPDGPRVEPRRLSEHCLRNMDINDRISPFVIVNFSEFVWEFHKLLQNASVFYDTFHIYGNLGILGFFFGEIGLP